MKTLLVVDDDQDCREFAKAVLSQRYDVRTVASADQCRAELKIWKPDLLLLDVMMSHLSDGLDLAKELKDSPDTSFIPVIMVTNVNDVYDYRSHVDAAYFPHDRWLEKPVKATDLLKAVGDVLDKSAKIAAH
ncbi:MAG: response regulator [bacterium]